MAEHTSDSTIAPPAGDLVGAAEAIEIADNVVGRGIRHLAASGGPDRRPDPGDRRD